MFDFSPVGFLEKVVNETMDYFKEAKHVTIRIIIFSKKWKDRKENLEDLLCVGILAELL